MKNETNIYDIDGEIVRKAGDNHKMTIEEAQEKMRAYAKKAEDNPEKADVYRTYVRNLSNFVYNKLMMMSKDEFSDYVAKTLPKSAKKTTAEEVENALNSMTQDDMMVERDIKAPEMEEIIENPEEV